MNNYFQTFKFAIARIFHANGAVVGAGFLVSERYLLTCAHVVKQALAPLQSEIPQESINLDFPLINPNQKLTAQVIFWRPYQSSSITEAKVGEDIAVLEIHGELPGKAQPMRLIKPDNSWGHTFRIFGFPKGHNDGIWATGELREVQGKGWVQMENFQAGSRSIEPGFSGAPIWDEVAQGVIGMAVSAERKREGVTAAFGIPTQVLEDSWTELQQFFPEKVTTTSALDKVKAIKAKTYQQRLDILLQDFEDVYNQLNYTSNSQTRNNLKRQIDVIDKEISEANQKLDDLAG